MKGETLQASAPHSLRPAAPEGCWIARGQALLGTIVQIGIRLVDMPAPRASTGDLARAHAAIERGFAAIREIDGLMSFHHPGSEVSALNRAAFEGAVRVNRHTFEVLRLARETSIASNGVFDVTVAPLLVADGALPPPPGARSADPDATWQDVELLSGDRVRFRRRLWIDLGGIAKGYAVDLALQRMDCGPRVSCYVNAGGDIRVAGTAALPIVLRAPGHSSATWPVVELSGASLASSEATRTRCREAAIATDGSVSWAFASVVAQNCVTADALTKIVLAGAADSSAILARFDARAHCFDAQRGWRALGVAS